MLTLFSTFRKQQSGFTLVEIAVVLVIVGLLVGSFIGTFSSRIDTTRRDNTKKELEEIKRILMAYAFTKTPPQLPCPDTDADGLADTVFGNCTAAGAVGLLPWRDLGFGDNDAWDNRYSYWVSNNYAGTAGFDLNAPDVGGGNAAIGTRVNDMVRNMVTNAAAVIFSHGKNGLGAISVENTNRPAIPPPGNGHDDENENIDANFVFMSRTPTEEGAATIGGVFDDILVGINSYELKAKMVDVGVLPP